MGTCEEGLQSWEARLTEATFGERLAEARRLKGETIEEVSEQLRIRPSIILAMETSNYAHMPHKGYARNMVSSYARYLGLNSTVVTEQFLKEFRRWESSGNNAGVSSNANRFALTSKRNEVPDDPVLESERKSDGREMISAAKRNQSRSSVWGKEDKRNTDREFRNQMRQAQEDRGLKQSTGSRRASSSKWAEKEPDGKQIRANDYVGKPPRKSAVAGVSAGLSKRPVLLIIGLVVVLIALLVLWAFLASTCAKNETTNVPVTGVTNTDSGLSEDETSDNVEDIEAQIEEDNRYGPFELTIEIVDGSSWLQIDVDGATPVGQVCEAGWKETFTVSSTATIQAGAPSNVKVYRNGAEVALEDGDGVGYLELVVEQRPITQNAQDADTRSQS